ncbi:MAG: LysM peptidoglycan-binding domain-containing protein [Candidatus Chisholmbacteria bacterium]|nr:LysM peptidoglycan-binding domain-containing protein [Candidatus Chisholmbacteria bacterium]
MEDQLKRWLKQLKLNESTVSMFLGALVVIVVGILIYNYFTSVDQGTPEILEPAEETVQLVEEDGKFVPSNLPTKHTVAAGEHLWSIAERYFESGYNWVDIARENKLARPDMVTVGQELTIPRAAVIRPPSEAQVAEPLAPAANTISGTSYTVVKGDNLWSIAVRAYQDGYKWPEIAKANSETVTNPNLIEVGMVLKLPR